MDSTADLHNADHIYAIETPSALTSAQTTLCDFKQRLLIVVLNEKGAKWNKLKTVIVTFDSNYIEYLKKTMHTCLNFAGMENMTLNR